MSFIIMIRLRPTAPLAPIWDGVDNVGDPIILEFATEAEAQACANTQRLCKAGYPHQIIEIDI